MAALGLNTKTSDKEGDLKMAKRRVVATLAGALALAASPSWALDPMPAESGFSGFAELGYSYTSIKSNLVAGLGIGSYDEITPESVDSIFQSPDERTAGLPAANFFFGYTFDSRTQVFLGRELIDVARFDFTNQLGVRQELRDKSVLGASFVFSGIPTKLWEDPYVEGANRGKTDRDSSGARLSYDRMFGSNAILQYTYRKIDIDNERSGDFLVAEGRLNPADRSLLERDGNQHLVELGYRFKLADNRVLLPQVAYTYDNRDGEAMKSNTLGLQLTYLFQGQRFNWAFSGGYSYSDYDKSNPIYGKSEESDNYGVGARFYDTKLLSNWLGQGWSVGANGGYYKIDSNISFHDQTVWSLGASVLYRF
jgi:hypothetical protein